MISAPKPNDEESRLCALRATGLLDTDADPDFDELVELASALTGMPMALVSLVDEDRQWCKARRGLAAQETPRDVAFCAHAILRPDAVFSVSDARCDERFHDNPLVVGEPGIQSYHGVPLLSPNRQPLGTLCVLDVVPRELSEHQIRSLEILCRQVERILALSAARDEAEEATRAKSRFIAIASHEIRSPLHGILGTIELALDELREAGLEGQYRDDMQLALESSLRLSTLLDNLLDLSKVEARRMDLYRAPVALRALAGEVVGTFCASAALKGVDLRVRIASTDDDVVLLDRARTVQVLTNLVGNAVKFTDEGSIELAVERTGDGRTRFTVRDSGPGIPEDAFQRIFEPFEQCGATRRGSGLGLAVVRELVQLMGGECGVASRLGEGSTFWIEFDSPAAATLEQPEGLAGSVGLEALAGLRVLIVDDLDESRAVTLRMLASLGVVAEGAPSGEAALALLERRSFDLVLLDYEMPGMDGGATCRAIRERLGDAIPVVGLTGSAEASVLAACQDAGMQSVLTKPIDAARLGERILRAGAGPG